VVLPVVVPYDTRPRPRPLDDGPVVERYPGWDATVGRRLQRLRSDAGGVRVRWLDAETDGLVAALREARGLLPRGPAPEGVGAHLAGLEDEVDRLADEVTLRQPADLVVLRRTAPGRLAAELLAVAFPSGWAPRRRAGASFEELHSPVAEGERLLAAASALSEALVTKGPFLQHVWGLQPDRRLDHDPSAPDAWRRPDEPVDPAAWRLRVERQVTVPLPALERALFWIRPTLTPLGELSPADRATLAAAVASMSPASLAYKGLSGDRDRLVRWLRGAAPDG
jgi:hypothetical protein